MNNFVKLVTYHILLKLGIIISLIGFILKSYRYVSDGIKAPCFPGFSIF